ncbi:NAF1 domain protein [Ancylostoma caninum]|uniref:H/ACA ribonucleoprotein complex non-core subunit NAF1 n=1 Tax=Ancylostoma caninum TaxID=29170 RepID=A0A368GVC7_ANCCA|nr:NAF1 domain protein [Ancylostoma caninum]
MGEPMKMDKHVTEEASPTSTSSSTKEDGIVETIMRELVDRASFWSEPSTLESPPMLILSFQKNFFTLDYRKAPSLGSASSVDGSEFGDLSDCELSLLESEEDSDKEFERLQRYTCEIRLKKFKEDHPDGVPDRKKSKNEVVIDTSDFQNEYDTLPPLENLCIHCDESIPLEVVGHVTSVVDCLVVIQSEGGVALDFDSVLFDKDRNSIGVVFDLFGPVRSPLYSVRFNTKEEAAKLQVGMNVYYAPKAEQYTRTVIETQLKEPEEVCDYSSEDEAVFSDDEKEREYRARKSAQARSAKETAATGSSGRRGQKRRVQFSESISRGGGRGRGGQNRGQHRGRGGSWNWHSERGGYPGQVLLISVAIMLVMNDVDID